MASAIGGINSARVAGAAAGSPRPDNKEVAELADKLGMKGFQSSESAAGTRFYNFRDGTIRWSNVKQSIDGITFTGPGDMRQGELQVPFARMGVALGLGNYLGTEHGMHGKPEAIDFANGQLLLDPSGVLSGLQPGKSVVNSKGELVSFKAAGTEVPPAVVLKATSGELGEFVSAGKDPDRRGMTRFTFQRGAISANPSGKILP